MAKQTKAAKPVATKAVKAQPKVVKPKAVKPQAAPVAAPVTGPVLVATGKVNKLRVGHTQQAWQAVLAALPAPASVLYALPALANPKCVSPQGYIGYMVRRGYLTTKA